MNTHRQFYITRPNGVLLHAIAHGPTGSLPIVLLHGLSDSWRSFEPLLARLPENQSVVALSQRGHGASSRPSGVAAYCATNFVDDVRALLANLGKHRAIVVGHSLGAWVACHLARQYPDMVAGLVLIGGFAQFADNVGVAELQREIAGFSDPIDPAFIRSFQKSASSPDLPAIFFETIVAESMRVPAHVWREAVASLIADDVPDDYPEFKAPTRLIWGDRDPFVSEDDQRQLCGRISTAALSIHQGAGHAPHWERPGEVAQELTAFASLCDRLPKPR